MDYLVISTIFLTIIVIFSVLRFCITHIISIHDISSLTEGNRMKFSGYVPGIYRFHLS